ncbi:hypothetical protein [Noviherbaspirillum pedocola]|uniref:Uncharacterized protein n=1 Tax=Noviherbaspirillum pedocola TaxID=2801341 RepID=A0A934W9A1_9BURK|nr:hypothetical protein [Noviherbaspirillum pedocola]MBK4736794.1 hypothetical protein [Noviherbaspirillum pedocola]
MEDNPITSANAQLSVDELRQRIGQAGDPGVMEVYAYAVTSVEPYADLFLQTGSGPNFAGGLITLCTCKHEMRTAHSSQQWSQGDFWIAGLSSWDVKFGKRQSLVYLMRVAAAYDSQAALVEALRQSGRNDIVESKSASANVLGDLYLPKKALPTLADRLIVDNYLPPILGHAHHGHPQDTEWEADIRHIGKNTRPAALLVGDPEWSFTWDRPMVVRSHPGPTRSCRRWTLSHLLNDLV